MKNAYPLPLVSDLLDKLRGAKYFSKMDVQWGYNNIRIRKGDKWKAAFKTKFGLYKPTVVFFGLCNSPAMFQTMMDQIFVTQINGNEIVVYMDDILLYAKTKEDLNRITQDVLQVLKDNKLYLKPEKCEFEKEEIEYLGMIISKNRIRMDEKKLKGITEWLSPTSVKETRSFLGFGNFYRQFIRHYSGIVKPLNNLLKLDRKFDWSDEAKQAFLELKKRFSSQPVLMMPDPTKEFQVEADASKFASNEESCCWLAVYFYQIAVYTTKNQRNHHT